jgi:hypothetical protein
MCIAGKILEAHRSARCVVQISLSCEEPKAGKFVHHVVF